MIYALDSDIVSYLLKHNKDVQRQFNKLIVDEDNFYSIPPLVYYEVKRGLTEIKATKKLKEFNGLYYDSIQKEMTTEIWEKAIEIWVALKSKGRLIGDGDIFIASYCIINGYTLITNNTKHYANINELQIINLLP